MDASSDSSPSLRWRLLRWVFFGFVGLIVLLGGLWGEENTRGKRAWETYKHELEAAGEKLTLDAFIPPPVSDDQNFATTPFLAPLFNFTAAIRPGNSVQRDTNSFRQTSDFANDLPYPKASSDNREQGKAIDLGEWLVAIRTKADRKASTNLPPTRAAAAEEMLTVLKRYDSVLAELTAAGQRPYSRFNLRYGDGLSTLLPHLGVLKRASQLYQLRASAELESGQADAALADINMALRLGNSITNEPFLISGLVSIAMVQLAMQPIWEGLAGRRWSEPQLADLQQKLTKFDFLAEYCQAIRGERAESNDLMDQLRQRKLGANNQKDAGLGAPPLPSGWIFQNQVLINRMYQEKMLMGVDAVNQRVEPAGFADDTPLDKELATGFRPYKILAQMLVPAVAKATTKYAYAQTSINEAMVACALERYRLANAEFPENLAALVPRFITALPHDIFGGAPLHYRRESDGQFILYSIGWNEHDDGGITGFTQGSSKTPMRDPAKGDWIWTSKVGN